MAPLAQQRRTGWVALAALVLPSHAGSSSLAPRSFLRGRAIVPRAAAACALDPAQLAESTLHAADYLQFSTSALVVVTLPTGKAVVDDVAAGLTGGFVGVAGTLFCLELRKQSLKNSLLCEWCDGKGTLTCGQCFGKGCEACDGKGEVKCISCGGSGRAVSSDIEKEQFRAIFGLFPEMRYGPESVDLEERARGGTMDDAWGEEEAS